MKVSRRAVNPSRLLSENEPAPFSSPTHSRSRRPPPYLSIALIILGAFLLIGYLRHGQGSFGSKLALRWARGEVSCSEEVHRAIPILKAAYGDSMRKVLHVGPDSCSVVSRLIREEEEADAWGVEPYDLEDANLRCKKMVHTGLVRVADIRFLLPYRAKSFSLVIVSDALDYLSPKYLNRTIPELARVSSDGLIIFTRYPRIGKAKSDKSRYGLSVKLRSADWWVQYFDHLSLEENEDVSKKFEQAAERMSHISHCQIFHIKPFN